MARLATRYKKLRQFANQGSRRRETPRIPRRQIRLGRPGQKVLTQGEAESRGVKKSIPPFKRSRSYILTAAPSDSRCGIRGMRRSLLSYGDKKKATGILIHSREKGSLANLAFRLLVRELGRDNCRGEILVSWVSTIEDTGGDGKLFRTLFRALRVYNVRRTGVKSPGILEEEPSLARVPIDFAFKFD